MTWKPVGTRRWAGIGVAVLLMLAGGVGGPESKRLRRRPCRRIVFNDKREELRREALLRELHQRIRDVRQGPDGLLYVLTEEDAAPLLRIEPVESPPAAASRP
jgi:hypothetical protein